jgi:hypothetical protein
MLDAHLTDIQQMFALSSTAILRSLIRVDDDLPPSARAPAWRLP